MKYIFTILLGITLSAAVSAQMAPQRVIAFKNGLSFVHETGEFQTVDGRYVTGLPFPNAKPGEEHDEDMLFTITAGSERVSSREGGVARYWTNLDTVMAPDRIEYSTVYDYLKIDANRGRKLALALKDGSVFSGAFEYIEDDVLYLRNAQTLTRIGLGEIRQITPEEPLRTGYDASPDELVYRTFNVEMAEPVGPTTQLDLYYLARGFNWTPVYSVVLLSENRLALTLDAQVVNGQKDYRDVDLQLGIGQPKFEYASENSAFFDPESVYTQSEWEFGGDANRMSNNFNQIITRPQATTRRSTMDASGLFFYRVPNFTLGRNQAGKYRLLTLETAYQHEYAVRLNTDEKGPLPVSHNIVFINEGQLPLTTGMALISDTENRAAGQSKMPFVPTEATTSLRLSGATEVVVTQVGETTKTDSIYRGRYQGYQTTFTVTIQNFKSEAVDLSLTRDVNGALRSSSVPSRLVSSNYTREINPIINNYRWNLTVPAGGEKTFTFTYEYWGG